MTWAEYDAAIPRALRCRFTAVFEREGFDTGPISFANASVAAAEMRLATAVPFRSADCAEGYTTCDFPPDVEDALNAGGGYRDIAGPLRAAIGRVLDRVQWPIALCLGTPWRVLNTRAWSTPPRVPDFGPYGWHTDGWPEQIFKAMLYFTPPSRESGGIELVPGDQLIFPKGTPDDGLWVLFKNSSVRHRGVPGTAGERLCAEITLCRSECFDMEPHAAGLNAHYPIEPPRQSVHP